MSFARAPILRCSFTAGKNGAQACWSDSTGCTRSERVHPVESLQQAWAPFFPAVNEHLSIGARAKLMSAPLQLAPQIEVVIQLAVENDPNAMVLVGHRLRPTLHVHDAEATMAEGDRTASSKVKSRAIGTPVGQRSGETRHKGSGVAARFQTEHTRDSAHLRTALSLRRSRVRLPLPAPLASAPCPGTWAS